MNTELSQSIGQTLAFFDMFDHPLTKEELYRWLWRDLRITDVKSRGDHVPFRDNPDLRIDYNEFLSQLEHLEQLQQFERLNGFYFLKGRKGIVEERQRRVRLVEEKMEIARRGIKKLRWIPFVRSVFVCNTLAGGYVKEDSDIDVFVVVQKGRLWLSRLFVTFFLSVTGLRRNKRQIKNKICLSFYVSDDHLDLKDIAIDEPDIYLMYWLVQLVSVYDPDNILADVQKANAWVKKYLLSEFQPYEILPREKVADSRLSRGFKRVFEIMWTGAYGNFLEAQAKAVQRARMKLTRGSVRDEPDTRVVISDSMLKFHENDRREEYRERWRSLITDH